VLSIMQSEHEASIKQAQQTMHVCVGEGGRGRGQVDRCCAHDSDCTR